MIFKISGAQQQFHLQQKKERQVFNKEQEQKVKKIDPKDTYVSQENPFNRNAKAPVEYLFLEILKEKMKNNGQSTEQ